MKRRRVSRSSSQDAQEANIANNNTSNTPNNNTNNATTPTQNGDAQNGGMGSTYCGELVMFDRHGRSLLTPGHYELMLELQAPGEEGEGDALPLCRSSPKKAAGWETINTLKLDGIFNHMPMLKFTLTWTSETSSPAPERPRLQPLKPLDVVLANSTSTKPRPQGKPGGRCFGVRIRVAQEHREKI